MPYFRNIMPKILNDEKFEKTLPLIVILAYEGVNVFELGMALEVFELANLDQSRYRIIVCSERLGCAINAGPLQIISNSDKSMIKHAHTIIVPGWIDVNLPPPQFVIDVLSKAYQAGIRLASICSGVFLLASAGALEYRKAAVHWAQADLLARRFPKIQVDQNVLYVDEGNILTSAGRAAGLDMCLHILRKDCGGDVMRNVARRLVIPAHREGGQTQFIPQLETGPINLLAELCVWLRQNLHKKHSIDNMAKRAHMSKRTFVRQFYKSTNSTPVEWLVQERLAYARQLLEDSRLTINDISSKCGFGSADAFRQHFRSKLGTSPGQYRSLFKLPVQ
jgi:AraC family transcriptional activator FtrA